jgi:HAE1 family hydrophobic/amphiphilic exporter-1
MSIARFSVTRPIAVIMRIAGLVLLGVICFFRLPVDLLPSVSMPMVSVFTQWPNVAPEEIEAEVTRPIERALSTTPGLYHISSSTEEGSSQVRVQFRWGVDIGRAAVDVLQLVQNAKRSFPTDPTLQDPIVAKVDPNQIPILIFGVSGLDDPVKLRTLLDNQVAPMIESAGGVASATVSGGQQRSIVVDVDPVRLRAHHIALASVIRRIMEENLNLPAGIAKQSDTEYVIRSLGWLTSVDEIAAVPLGSFGGQIVSVSDVASVRDSHTETRLYSRLDGAPAVGLIVIKQSGANTVSTAQGVFDRIEMVRKIYPKLKFGLAYDQSRFISDSVHDLKNSAIIGGILAVLILLFFLRNIRSTLVVALSIPTSIISTFALLYLCGFTLNTMSLGGLALATGLIVDDAVVVLENIFRHIERDKKSPTEAAISGTGEIMSAVVASTWTVMVVFLPLLLIKGQSGQMFTQFALVVIFSLAVSLLDATTVVPMLASRFISGEAHAENLARASRHHQNFLMRMFHRFGLWFDALDGSYRDGLRWALRHKKWVIGGALAITGSSFLLWPWIGTELMPQTDSGDFRINVKMPIGTALDKTNEVMLKVEEIVNRNPNVKTAFSTAGSSMSIRGTISHMDPAQGSVTIKLKDNRRASTQDVIDDLRRQLVRIPGVRPRLTQYDLVSTIMSGGPQYVEVDIFGDDLTVLSQIGREVLRRVRDIPGLQNVDVNWQETMPEIQWKVDRRKSSQAGVTFQDVADTISTATNGEIASYYQEKGFQYPIVVQMPERVRKTVAQMEDLVVTPSIGGPESQDVLLGQLAQPVYGTGPSEITRLDRQRYIAVFGTPQGRSSGDIQVDVEKALSGMTLPSGYYRDWGIDQKRRAEEFGGMWLAVALAICIIYMLLAAQFESLIHPLTILLSVPLAATGVLLALFLSGRAFGLTAFIGVLMLVGIVVKNGILLVDYTNVLRGRGMERNEALLTAGPTRLRPILMTASAATLGMLPIALGFGKGSEIQGPMATAVIGGLITSTALTLFVVPTVYALLDDTVRRFSHRRKPTAI